MRSAKPDRMALQIDYWFAITRRGRSDKIAQSLDKVDMSNISDPAVALCIHDLKRDDEAFYSKPPLAIEAHRDDLLFMDWHIFDDIRITRRFANEVRRWLPDSSN
jgi:hypothetical protein